MKIDEGKLMAYLYGELSKIEEDEVEKYFQENPDALKQFQDMSFVRGVLGKATDKEVIAPPIFMTDEKPAISLWHSSFVRFSVGIAAALVIMMVGAKLLGVQMNYANQEFTLSFGDIKKQEVPVGLSPNQVQQLIDASLAKNNHVVQASFNESQNKWNETLRQNAQVTSTRLNEISKTAAASTQEEIRQFMERMRAENSAVVQDYLRLSAAEQKSYIETLLVDFSQYMQEQRSSDLNLVNVRLNSLEQESNQFREEAGEILTSLISNANPSNGRRN